MRNELDRETSPYLLSHASNPVHWQAWSENALALARAEDKPILLSVGYAACHWCHVMAHESFEDPATAEVLNRHFVPVKVDREERPDLDAIYQTALQMLGEHGGWPLTMFLTPDGTPFWGGTYFPPEARYGRPGFRALLTRVAEVYAHERDKVTQNAAAMRDALGRMADAAGGGPIPDDLPVKVAQRLLAEFDQTHGGIGTAPKFPHVPVFELVLRAGLRSGDEAMKRSVLLALRMMCQGGIYDHLGGGFARYSTDAMWLVPHFEKMLYDNAQLMALLNLAHGLTGDALYARRLEETAGWVLREMIADGGGFAASLDADSEGEEGRYYVWTESEIDRVLGPGADSDFFKRVYGVTSAGNWEGKVILNRIGSPETLDDAAEARLGPLRARLFAARNRRPRPGWDDKVLADWNGLMISALARAGVAFGRREWLAAARDAFDFVNARLRVPGGDRLVHSYRAGRQGGAATLDDYAAMINAAITLFECFGDDSYLEVARAWIRVLDRHFRDPGNGGYFLTADDARDLIVRARNALDGATPSGNAMCVAAFARLYALTGDAGDREAAEAVVRAFSGELERNIFPHATLMNAAELLARAAEVVIVGDPGAGDTEALRSAAFRAPQPNLVLQVVAPSATLPEGHPAAGKGRLGTAATAYVCVGPTCSLPFTDPENLCHALARA